MTASNPAPTTATVTPVASSATAVTLLAENASAVLRMIHNDSVYPLYVRYGTGAATDDYSVKIGAGGHYELPVTASGSPYGGIVTGIWSAADGYAYCTEV